MKATVANLKFLKTFQTRNGEEMYSWHVTMDNGDAGEVATKTHKEPWAIGEEAEFTTEQQTYGDKTYTKIKKVFAQGGGGYKGGGGSKWTPDPEKESRVERWAKQTLIGRQACLNTAASLIASGGGPSTLDNLFALADKIEEHVHRGVDIRRLAKGTDVKPAQVTNDAPAQYAKPAPAPAKADPNYTDTDGSPLPF
jgi:hypothetical protein